MYLYRHDAPISDWSVTIAKIAAVCSFHVWPVAHVVDAAQCRVACFQPLQMQVDMLNA